MKLAAESPFAGERENALAAAKRLAERHGMTLEEAAGDSALPRRQQTGFASQTTATQAEAARYVHLMDWQIAVAKMRRDSALSAARSRGLDAHEFARRRMPEKRVRANPRRLDPWTHARVLLAETNLRLADIVQITGLTIYQVVGLKLNMRRAAAA
ncbi:MAG TPA: hypothetical protein VH835_11325 [Dongiaceae bacterium]